MHAQGLPSIGPTLKRGVSGTARKLGIENILGRLDCCASLLSAGRKCLSTHVGCLDGIKVGVKLTLRHRHRHLCISHPVSLSDLNLQALQLCKGQLLHMLVQPPSHDAGRGGAMLAGMLFHAHVVVVVPPPVLASPGASHHMSARRAAHQTREQCWTRSRARWTRIGGELPLYFVKGLLVNQRLVCGWVDVFADSQLPQVDAIPQKGSHAARGHAQTATELADAGASKEIGKCRDNFLARLRIRRESAVLAFEVATRTLPPLPNPRLGCIAASFVKALGVLFALVRVNADEKVAMESAAGGAGVDPLFDRDNLATGRLNAAPGAQLLGDVPTEPRQVGNDDAGVDAALDAFDCSKQRGSLLDRQPTGDIQLGRQHLNPHAVCLAPGFDGRDLIFIGMEVVRPLLPLAQVAHSYDGRVSLHGTAL